MKFEPFENIFKDSTSNFTKVKKEDYQLIGTYPIIDQGQAFIGGFTDDEKLIVNKNLPVIIFGDHTKVFKYVDFPFTIGADGVKVLALRNEKENALFYYYFLKSIKIVDKGYSRHFKYLKEKKLPVLNYANQLHIANLLSKAENLIAQRKESIRLLDEFLKSTFLEMFGDPVNNEKGWDTEQLSFITQMKAGQFVSASDIQTNFKDGLFSCYGGNGLRGYVTTFTHNGEFVLIGRQGALCGNVKIAKGQFHATEHAVVCSPKMKFETYWFYYLLDIINLNKYASGSAQPGLAVGKLEQIKIIFPPLELQTQFAQIVEKTEALKTQYLQSMQELENLYGSLSQKAFRGELIIKDESLLMAAEPKSSYVAQSNIPDNKRGFAKQVLGGKIVSLFKDDNNFTHIKFQKLQYLAEQVAEENLLWNYYRQAAGPHDNKFKYSVIAKLNENKWFEERNYMFYPLQKANDVDRYYKNYFGNKSDRLNELFLLLKNATEKFCEAIATIYAVWNNQIILQLPYNKSEIKKAFFEWSNRKEIIFTEDEFEKALEWMKKHNIEPIGFGQLIKEKTGKK